MRTFVLVHGSWHGGWCYRDVADLLIARGYRVFTPTLTGLADRSHLLTPNVDLETHIDDIVNLMDWEDLNDVTLCGHSYGGIPVTGAADRRHEKITSLVYLDAFVPRDDESLIDITKAPMPRSSTEPSPPATTFVHRRDKLDWCQSKLTPHPNRSRTQKITLSGRWTSIAKKSYVRAPDFAHPVMDEMLARFSGDPTWTTSSLYGGGHDLMIDRPKDVADLLEALKG